MRAPVLLSAALVLACLGPTAGGRQSSAIRVRTLEPGRSSLKPESGIVIGRFESVTPSGRPDTAKAPGQGERRALYFVNPTTHEDYLLELSEDGPLADFYLELPAGEYRTIEITGCLGSFIEPEQQHLVSFEVEPGVVTYVGTLRRIGIALLHCPTFTVADEMAPLLERFAKRYPRLAQNVQRSLIESQPID